MLRSASILASFLFVGCASAPTRDLRVDEPLQLRSTSVSTASEAPADAASSGTMSSGAMSHGITPLPSAALESASSEPVLSAPAPEPRLVPEADALHQSRFTIKGGYYSAEDADELDDGYIFNVSWMRYFTSILAIELEVGYFDADGSDAGLDADVWGAPVMLNGRVNVPIWVLDVYGGLGVGGIYYDAEVSGGASAEDDGFLMGGNAFLGTSLNLAEAISLGLEAKYYVTEDIDDLDVALDAFALMLTVGFSR